MTRLVVPPLLRPLSSMEDLDSKESSGIGSAVECCGRSKSIKFVLRPTIDQLPGSSVRLRDGIRATVLILESTEPIKSWTSEARPCLR